MICKDNVGFKELENYILTLEDKKSSLIIILHKAQEIFGYIPEEVQEFIAEKIEVPVSKVYGVVSFYNFFSMEPKGKISNICLYRYSLLCKRSRENTWSTSKRIRFKIRWGYWRWIIFIRFFKMCRSMWIGTCNACW